MKLSNNKPVKLNEAIVSNINKGINVFDQQIGKNRGSNEWNKSEEELMALYLEIGRNIVIDNYLPF